MRILAIESSALTASVALCDEFNILAQYSVYHKKTHSQTLLPMIDEIMRMSELTPSDLDAVAVTKGPGSFTGLRIGMASAKGLCLALDIPVIAVSTLEALAANLIGSRENISPIMDARRNQVYTGLYDALRLPKALEKERAIGILQWIDILNKRGEAVAFLGDAVAVHADTIAKSIKVPFRFASANQLLQSAASLSVIAVDYYKKGIFADVDGLVPEYLRLSQAERERQEKLKENQSESNVEAQSAEK
ncbi:MAG: tRNA (adenosine(37)-N6)-threonylcarbamoyltransferase complex dimerization subunit type 1 TsaB [Lachnospiraceae bacterium]|jgi:tRNA threonylcarbamoyladenosine biosynthesis protein TsaB|nr:tRNA (adenosine(37)-N6)-threonylcarbamoyltransferase complex dimerization subunit type 1 TsaB [Lachnospiraceae bacterium]